MDYKNEDKRFIAKEESCATPRVGSPNLEGLIVERILETTAKICDDVLTIGLNLSAPKLCKAVKSFECKAEISVDLDSSVSRLTLRDRVDPRSDRIEISFLEILKLVDEQKCSIWTAATNITTIYAVEYIFESLKRAVPAARTNATILAIEAGAKAGLREEILHLLTTEDFTESHILSIQRNSASTREAS